MAGGRRLTFSFASELPEVYFFCLSVWLSVLAVLIYRHLADPGMMGQRHPGPTPLSLITDHFKKVRMRAHDLSGNQKNKLISFCSAEWPTFSVGWPSEGTFDLETVHRVRDIIFRPRIRHPDQVPYIIVWENVVLCPTPWVKPFLPQQGFSINQVLVTRTGKSLNNPKEPEPMVPLYPILQGGAEEELFPPPYQPPEPPRAPAIPPPRAETQEGGPHEILAIVEPCPGRGQQTQPLPSPYEWPAPPMRKETNLINIGPSLLVIYITGDPRMPSSQITLEI